MRLGSAALYWTCPMKWLCEVYLHLSTSRTQGRRMLTASTREGIQACRHIQIEMKPEELGNNQARSNRFTIRLLQTGYSTRRSLLNSMKAHSANINHKFAIANSTQTTHTITMWVSNQVWEKLWDLNQRKEPVEVPRRRRFKEIRGQITR